MVHVQASTLRSVSLTTLAELLLLVPQLDVPVQRALLRRRVRAEVTLVVFNLQMNRIVVLRQAISPGGAVAALLAGVRLLA